MSNLDESNYTAEYQVIPFHRKRHRKTEPPRANQGGKRVEGIEENTDSGKPDNAYTDDRLLGRDNQPERTEKTAGPVGQRFIRDGECNMASIVQTS